MTEGSPDRTRGGDEIHDARDRAGVTDIPEPEDVLQEPASERLGDDVPEPDALEQARHVSPSPRQERPRIGSEVPEADAVEQSQPHDLDEEEDRP